MISSFKINVRNCLQERRNWAALKKFLLGETDFILLFYKHMV